MNQNTTSHISSRRRKLILKLAIPSLALLVLLGGFWFTFASPNHFIYMETITHRTVQDATLRFFKAIEDNDQSAIARYLATPPEPNEAFSKAAGRRDEITKSLTARGVASAKIDDVIWIMDSFPPTISTPSLATNALVTARITLKSGDEQILYVRLWDNTPEVSQQGYTGALTRTWKVVDIHTEKPPFPYIIVDDSVK